MKQLHFTFLWVISYKIRLAIGQKRDGKVMVRLCHNTRSGKNHLSKLPACSCGWETEVGLSDASVTLQIKRKSVEPWWIILIHLTQSFGITSNVPFNTSETFLGEHGEAAANFLQV